VPIRGPYICKLNIFIQLQKGEDPCIINNSSLATRHGAPTATIYGAAKGAIGTFTKSAATGGSNDKIKMEKFPFKNQYSIVPIYHYSIFGTNSEVPNNLHIFSRLLKFRDV
jgi:hypothetical protein